MRYQYRILQTGTLPLRPDRRYLAGLEHRCTSALLWPDGTAPSPDNAVLTDPCFTFAGYQQARGVAAEVGIDLASLRYAFLTHGHADHQLNVPPGVERPQIAWFVEVTEELPGLATVACPGHSEDSRSLVFRDAADRCVYVAGDAVLDREWLLAWGFFWPNMYSPQEVMQTWHSVAEVLTADIIIPGHGEPIEVTAAMREELARTFDAAEYANECGGVRERIRARLPG